MPFPPAHILAGIAAAELVRGRTRRWWLVWTAAGLVALLPDLDVVFRLATGPGAPVDRSVTHSLAAMAVAGLAVWGTGGGRWAAVVAAAYGSHLAADLLQTQSRTSVALLWPLQERGMVPLAHLFPAVPVERGAGMRRAALSLLEPAAASALLTETAIAAALCVVCVIGAAVLRRRLRGA